MHECYLIELSKIRHLSSATFFVFEMRLQAPYPSSHIAQSAMPI
jgi:hypothetical protein